ncbi:MAG: M4 family metallopeptidase [Candidatus Zixiibacteriota bacterium]
MKKSLITLSVIFLYMGVFSTLAFSRQPDKINTLRNNKSLIIYKENNNGVVEYAEGVLSSPAARGNEISASYSFFDNNKSAFRMINPAEELVVNRVEKDHSGKTHIRFNQQYNGVRVIGGELIIHFNTDNIIKTVNGNYIPGIELEVQAELTSYEAIAIAQTDLESFFGTGTPDNPMLVIFPWQDEYFLAWQLFLFSETPMGRWEYLIDAVSGDVIFKANRIMDANDIGIGIGVMGNAYDHIDTDFNGSEYEMIDYTRQTGNNPHGHNGQMASGNYIKSSIASSSLPGIVAKDIDNVWTDASQASAVDGHFYTTLYYDWLLSELNRNGYTDGGNSMNVTVDYSGEGNNNAYWNGSRIVIWSWSSGWRSLAGCPDVIAHEWGHAVTEYTSNLVYQLEPGALNESFSDIMGAAFEFAFPQYDFPDWYMGENAMISGNGFRSMSNPHLFGDPDTYGPGDPYWVDVENCTPAWYNDYCGVHTNSGVGNKWFFLLSDGGTHNNVTVQGIGVANAIKVAYQANAFYWTSSTNYHEAALGTISAAYDLDTTNIWAIEASYAWNAVGVDVPNPEIFFSADPASGWMPLDVNLAGSSVLNVVEWNWDLGDGDSAVGQYPSHIYDSVGMYDVTLEIVTDQETRVLTQPNFIIVVADTLKTDSISGVPGQSMEIVIYGNNTVPINQIIIPVEYPGNLSLSYDSISVYGCKTDYFDIVELSHYDPFNRRITINIETSDKTGSSDLPAGQGDVVKLYMTINSSATSGQTASIILDGYNSYLPFYSGNILDYAIESIAGEMAVISCILRGDIDSNGGIDIADLVYFVEYSFDDGPPPPSSDHADIDCSGEINIGDIIYMVDYMFDDGPEPCPCIP